MMIYDQTTLLNALLNAYTQHFLIIGWPPQFDLYSFSHADINTCDLDTTGGWIHAYLFLYGHIQLRYQSLFPSVIYMSDSINHHHHMRCVWILSKYCRLRMWVRMTRPKFIPNILVIECSPHTTHIFYEFHFPHIIQINCPISPQHDAFIIFCGFDLIVSRSPAGHIPWNHTA